MASFFLDKSRNTWTCQYKDPTTGKIKARRKDDDGKPFPRKKDAVAWYKQSGYDLESGAMSDPGKHTVATWMKVWADSGRVSNQPSTIKTAENAINNHIVPAIGGVKLSAIKPEHARLLVSRMAQTLKPSTLKLVYGLFASSMKMAVEEGMISRSPCTKRVTLPPSPAKRPNYCTAEQTKAIINELKEGLYALPIYMCITLGVRRGEALGLKWADIEGNRLHIHMQLSVVGCDVTYKPPKTKRSDRWLDIPPSLQVMLNAHRKKQLEQKLKYGPAYADEGFVCAGEGGGCLSPHTMSMTTKRIFRKLGLPEETKLHDLRHTYATLLYQAGYPIDVVADLLGDTVETAQKYYVGEDKKRQQEAAKTMDILLGR